ncbi:hypothetical protein LOD99_7682 [Oopsacas minuta]|uniref:PH domain-containing protein n=1 Tax=Oopsacas minuta TaxID=111878 RepID=A0AAV7JP99_9METZ|nr:hypothetical protein LOD99_7682 [Oopsacas minuta]
MAQFESARSSEVNSNGTTNLKSFEGIVDFWDGTITQDRILENKIKWKKRCLELQASKGVYIYLLLYKPTHRKKKHIHVPLLKFALADETSSIYIGPNFKNKYTFDVGVRIGKLFMRYRFGVESEESRNRWIYEIVTSFYINPNTPHSLKYLVTPMNTPTVMKLRMNEPSYLLLFKDHIEICRLSDLARIGKWSILSVHSYTTDKNIFTIKFRQNSMYGEIEVPFCSDYTVELFRILNSLVTTGEFPELPQVQTLGIRRNKVVKKSPVSHPLPGMKERSDCPKSPYMSPILGQRNNGEYRVKKTVSNPDNNKIFPVNNLDPSRLNTAPHPHSPERKLVYRQKQRANNIISEVSNNEFDVYSRLNHFPEINARNKEKFPLLRTDDVTTYSEQSQASHSTGNIPTLYSAIASTSQNGHYSVANFHKTPEMDRKRFNEASLFIRRNSDRDLSHKPDVSFPAALPLMKTNSLHDMLSDDENPYDVISDPPVPPPKGVRKPIFLKKPLPPPPPPQPNDYLSVTLPERGHGLRGMKKSPSTGNHIGFGNFPLEENRQWVNETNQKPGFTSPQHIVLEDIKEST